MLDGILQLPWWGDLICVLLATHLTIVSVTLYLHRCQAHHAITLHPFVSHIFRFWLWFTTGQNTKEWVAVHRKHHAHTEGENDPHSPYVHGIRKVLLEGAELYRIAAFDPQVSEEYGHGTPDDWVESLYKRYSFTGMGICLLVYLALFGPIGLTYWAIQLVWIPFFAAGLVNGAGHYWGYRNFEPQDGSTNLTNIGIIIGGEELHNNHHAYPSSARFSVHWWEFDIGWMYIRLLSAVGLAEVKKVAPRPKQQNLQQEKEFLDLESVRAMLTSKLHVMADYTRQVTLPVLKAEIVRADETYRATLKRVQKAIIREQSLMTDPQIEHLNQILHDNLKLKIVYDYQQKLTELWTRKYKNNEGMLKAVAEWCQEAEATGIRVLEEFARSLRSYSLQPIYNHA
jgi:stearoyl-CoA desaturase (delta-9 desaturase)